MICPHCNVWTRVLTTKQRPDNTTLRRYECANGHRFSTTEKVAEIKRGRPRKAI
jgi:transcriptional regulator NrdR family protein